MWVLNLIISSLLASHFGNVLVKAQTASPTFQPTELQTNAPTLPQAELPTCAPTFQPTEQPTNVPTFQPTNAPTFQPTNAPTFQPSELPTFAPVTDLSSPLGMSTGLIQSLHSESGVMPTSMIPGSVAFSTFQSILMPTYPPAFSSPDMSKHSLHVESGVAPTSTELSMTGSGFAVPTFQPTLLSTHAPVMTQLSSPDLSTGLRLSLHSSESVIVPTSTFLSTAASMSASSIFPPAPSPTYAPTIVALSSSLSSSVTSASALLSIHSAAMESMGQPAPSPTYAPTVVELSAVLSVPVSMMASTKPCNGHDCAQSLAVSSSLSASALYSKSFSLRSHSFSASTSASMMGSSMPCPGCPGSSPALAPTTLQPTTPNLNPNNHPTATNKPTTRPKPLFPVHPLVDCVLNFGNGTCATWFGYYNPGSSMDAQIGGIYSNSFFPAPEDRGQPTTFLPGRQDYVFIVSHRCHERLHWKLGSEVVHTGSTTTCVEACCEDYGICVNRLVGKCPGHGLGAGSCCLKDTCSSKSPTSVPTATPMPTTPNVNPNNHPTATNKPTQLPFHQSFALSSGFGFSVSESFSISSSIFSFPVTSTLQPTFQPTHAPTHPPIIAATTKPTHAPTEKPTNKPTSKPTHAPTHAPTYKPTEKPTNKPTNKPTHAPTHAPTYKPTEKPTEKPTQVPTYAPTEKPTHSPTYAPTVPPTNKPTHAPTNKPTHQPTSAPTVSFNIRPVLECTTNYGNGVCRAYFGYVNYEDHKVFASIGGWMNNSFSPGSADRGQPVFFNPGRVIRAFNFTYDCDTPVTWRLGYRMVTAEDSNTCIEACCYPGGTCAHHLVDTCVYGTGQGIGTCCCSVVCPTYAPTKSPTFAPTHNPTYAPTYAPTHKPTYSPTYAPTEKPTHKPTHHPTYLPTSTPTEQPTSKPTNKPTLSPTENPTAKPSSKPTNSPTYAPTEIPTTKPSRSPTYAPTEKPTHQPTMSPTYAPTEKPSYQPTCSPTSSTPTYAPTEKPTHQPTKSPTYAPSRKPTIQPTHSPTSMPSRAVNVRPVLECTTNYGNGICQAYFGYMNYEDHTVFASIGGWLHNSFSPGNEDRGQPVYFQSGRVIRAFNFTYDCDTPVTWTLGSRTVTSKDSNTCTEACCYPGSTCALQIANTCEHGTAQGIGTCCCTTICATYAPTISPTTVVTNSPTYAPTHSPTVVPTYSPTYSPTKKPTSKPTYSPTSFPTVEPTPISTTQQPTTPNLNPNSNPTATNKPTASPTDKFEVYPMIECDLDFGNGTCATWFGYYNPKSYTINSGLSTNEFSPAPADRGQPMSFLPGRQSYVFIVPHSCSETLYWQLGSKTVHTGSTTTCVEACCEDYGICVNRLAGKCPVEGNGAGSCCKDDSCLSKEPTSPPASSPSTPRRQLRVERVETDVTTLYH